MLTVSSGREFHSLVVEGGGGGQLDICCTDVDNLVVLLCPGISALRVSRRLGALPWYMDERGKWPQGKGVHFMSAVLRFSVIFLTVKFIVFSALL